jgi:hypothetical protein
MFLIRGEWIVTSDSNFSKFAEPHDGQVADLTSCLNRAI